VTVHKSIAGFDPGPSARFADRVLKATRTKAALIGRLAVWAWLTDESEHEFTKNLDLAVSRVDLPALRARLAEERVTTREVPVGGVAVDIPDSNINVEFIDRTSAHYGDLGALFVEAVEAAYEDGESMKVGPATFHVAPPAYLIAMKLATGESRDERDVVRLLEACELDGRELHALVLRHLGAAGVGRLDELMRELRRPKIAGWPLSD
jgi:hypothetical protein